MEWNGMERNGMERNGMERNGMEWNGTRRDCIGLNWIGLGGTGLNRIGCTFAAFPSPNFIPKGQKEGMDTISHPELAINAMWSYPRLILTPPRYLNQVLFHLLFHLFRWEVVELPVIRVSVVTGLNTFKGLVHPYCGAQQYLSHCPKVNV